MQRNPRQFCHGLLGAKKEPAMEALLLVEDEPSLRTLLERYLTRAGFRVTAAETGDAALQLLPGDFAFAVVDLSLPDMDGRQVLEAIRQSSPRCRLVSTSGYPSAVLLEGERFLQKPFLPAQLIEILKS